MILKTIKCLIMLFLLCSNVYAWTQNDHYEYVGYTGELITVAWDHPANFAPETDDYEIKLYNTERDIEIPIAITTETQVTFATNKTGHWIPKARTRRFTENEYKYSGWSLSTDSEYATVAGQARSWIIFTWIAPVGPIEDVSPY